MPFHLLDLNTTSERARYTKKKNLNKIKRACLLAIGGKSASIGNVGVDQAPKVFLSLGKITNAREFFCLMSKNVRQITIHKSFWIGLKVQVLKKLK